MPWADPEVRKAYHKQYYQNNKDKFKESRDRTYPPRKDQIRENAFVYRLKTIYGMSRAEYDAKLLAQDGKCSICGTKEVKGKARQLHVDHCHTTGRIRGLLCMRCNTALGWYEKNIDYVAKYLEDA